ncbi:dihydroxyacetone kinase transcriptional activator DhaS [Clostridium manihotivorum]|uniref:Dihydroxyacetone kinase transcriptional activator DhaS n=1 Tax=Clostridium manihotivorum TaxID=2320868 RepID=A0A410E0P3_9CLOT|nr:dihydroxyacetone kinase transcriptional activator DhaS [Clostridium manihotivorum]QAA34871.1 dihydroxyacetone kinase transcriptional activator DhaS [Clostridium manihotivorum]
MSESLITKRALAASIKQLMETIPLSKISIQEIADNCGLNRQTFYYHFKDKFDLVNWIYYTEVTENIDNCRHYDNWPDGMYRTLCYLMNNKSFYINALNTPGQNAFDGYFFEFSYELILGVVNDLSIQLKVSQKDKKFICEFYTHAFVGIIVQWIKGGMKESPKIMVEQIRNIVEGSMLGALARY